LNPRPTTPASRLYQGRNIGTGSTENFPGAGETIMLTLRNTGYDIKPLLDTLHIGYS